MIETKKLVGIRASIMYWGRVLTSSNCLKSAFFLLSKLKIFSAILPLAVTLVVFQYYLDSVQGLIFVICWILLFAILRFRSLSKNSCFVLTIGWTIKNAEINVHFSRILDDSEFSPNTVANDLMSILYDAKRFNIKKIDFTSIHLLDEGKRKLIGKLLINRARKNGIDCELVDCGQVISWKVRLDIWCAKHLMPTWIAKNHFDRNTESSMGQFLIAIR